MPPDPRLQHLLDAAVQATVLAASAMSGGLARAGEDPEINRRREGEAAHRALMDALADYGYRECYQCAAPTVDENLIVVALRDGHPVRECRECLEFHALGAVLNHDRCTQGK